MKKVLCCILSLIILNGQVYAQGSANAKEEEPISEAQAMMQETAKATQQEAEETYDNNSNPQQRFEESPKHNVHNYNYKQQVIVGGSVMFCVILAMVVNNNYNPKPGAKK